MAARLPGDILHPLGRRFEDDLQLSVPEKAIRVLAVTAIGGATRRLRVPDADGLGPEHAQKRIRRHGAGADLDVVGLLQDAAALRPEALETKDDLLKSQYLFIYCVRGHALSIVRDLFNSKRARHMR